MRAGEDVLLGSRENYDEWKFFKEIVLLPKPTKVGFMHLIDFSH